MDTRSDVRVVEFQDATEHPLQQRRGSDTRLPSKADHRTAAAVFWHEHRTRGLLRQFGFASAQHGADDIENAQFGGGGDLRWDTRRI